MSRKSISFRIVLMLLSTMTGSPFSLLCLRSEPPQAPAPGARGKSLKILMTGAAGAIGSTVVKGLKDRYSLRGLDLVPMPDLKDAIVGDIFDLQTVLNATKDMDAVIHLAGVPSGSAPWESILRNNIIGTYNVFEAARQN